MTNKIRLAPGDAIWSNVDGYMGPDRLSSTPGDVVVILTGNVERVGYSPVRRYFQVVTPNGLGWVRKDFLRETPVQNP